MSHADAFEQLLAAKGFVLHTLGLRDVALLQPDALRAIEVLSESSIPVLGGDVYFRKGERIEPAYANWHTDPRPGENRLDYAIRSCRDSAKYIAGFPMRADVIPLFVLVIPPPVYNGPL